MALLQILLLLLYALPSLLLPITSNPLRPDETPDNLAYAAQSLENRYEHESPRKIPKSIFIAPDVQPCSNGVVGRDNRCFNSQTFEVNQFDQLTAQLEQFIDHDKYPTTSDYEDYEYDSTESDQPLKLDLDLSFFNSLPTRNNNKFDDSIQNMPFLAEVNEKEQPSQKHTGPSSIGSDTTEIENVVPTTSTVVSNDDEWIDRIISNNKDTTRDEVKSTTPSDVVITTPDESLLIFNDGISVSTTHKKVLVDADAFMNNEEEDVSSTENALNPTTTSDDFEDLDTTLTNRDTLHVNKTYANPHIENNHIESTTPVDDKNILDKELQSESLFQDDSSIGSSITVSDGTTEINENDVEVTTESLNSSNDNEFNKAVSISKPIPPFKSSNNSENPILVVPTVEQVQIVTPVQQSTTTSRSTTSTQHRKKSNNQSIPSSTATYNSELQTAEHLDINDSVLNKKLRESVMKHELNEDAIETIDTNNRFVYTHLDTSSIEPEPTTSTTMQPITQRSLLDQLRFINKLTEESRKNNRIRFPEPSPLNIFSNFKGGTIKFPGPVQQRTNEPLFNRLIPDLIPKKPPEPTAERALFSWLPAGTSLDFNRNSSPSFTRFWNKMPLIRDPSMTSNDTPEQSRSNSKSPTDNLYKDAPASEVYKVISSKNYKHDNR